MKLYLFRQCFPEPHILLSQRPHGKASHSPAVGCFVCPVNERIHILIVEDGKAVCVSEKEPCYPDVDILWRDGHRIIVPTGQGKLMGVVELIIQRNALAACRILLDIRGQRKHLKFRIPCGVRPADPSIHRQGGAARRPSGYLIGIRHSLRKSR